MQVGASNHDDSLLQPGSMSTVFTRAGVPSVLAAPHLHPRPVRQRLALGLAGLEGVWHTRPLTLPTSGRSGS